MKLLSRPGIQPPRLPKQLRAETPQILLEDGEYATVSWTGVPLIGQAAAHVHLEQILLRRVGLSQSRLSEVRMTDGCMESCDLAGIEWDSARLRRVEMRNCRLVGAQLAKSSWEDVLVWEGNCENAMWSEATFRSVRFEKCILRGAFFDGADLSGAIFDRCDLTHADLRSTKLRGTDFRGSLINGVQVGPQELQGAVLDPAQAVQVVGLLGIIVKEEESGIES